MEEICWLDQINGPEPGVQSGPFGICANCGHGVNQGVLYEMSETKLRQEFEKALEQADSDLYSSAEYRRKRLTFYFIRTTLAVVGYILLWDYQWIRWTLIFYMPLNLFGLVSIYGWGFILNRKIDRTRQKIEEAEQLIEELKEEESDL